MGKNEGNTRQGITFIFQARRAEGGKDDRGSVGGGTWLEAMAVKYYVDRHGTQIRGETDEHDSTERRGVRFC